MRYAVGVQLLKVAKTDGEIAVVVVAHAEDCRPVCIYATILQPHALSGTLSVALHPGPDDQYGLLQNFRRVLKTYLFARC